MSKARSVSIAPQHTVSQKPEYVRAILQAYEDQCVELDITKGIRLDKWIGLNLSFLLPFLLEGMVNTLKSRVEKQNQFFPNIKYQFQDFQNLHSQLQVLLPSTVAIRGFSERGYRLDSSQTYLRKEDEFIHFEFTNLTADDIWDRAIGNDWIIREEVESSTSATSNASSSARAATSTGSMASPRTNTESVMATTSSVSILSSSSASMSAPVTAMSVSATPISPSTTTTTSLSSTSVATPSTVTTSRHSRHPTATLNPSSLNS